MTINDYMQILCAIATTFLTIGLGAVVFVIIAVCWAAVRESWDE